MYANYQMQYNRVTVSVKVENNQTQIYNINGKSYFGVRDLTPYEFTVRNNTSDKILIVTSVDGKNVLSDSDAAYTDSGMILYPFQSYEFKGFRLNNKSVTEFVATFESGETINQQSGSSVSNCGVIGVAVFEEYKPPIREVYREPYSKSVDDVMRGGEVSRSFDSGSRSITRESFAGTGAGEIIKDEVSSESFNRKSNNPAETVKLFYKPQSWIQQAIEFFGNNPEPNPFPANGQTGYSKYKRLSR